jgi:hypothetical protein
MRRWHNRKAWFALNEMQIKAGLGLPFMWGFNVADADESPSVSGLIFQLLRAPRRAISGARCDAKTHRLEY